MRELAEKTVDAARSRGVQFADVRIVSAEQTTAQVQDGRADRLSSGSSRGAGIRVLVDGAWGFSSSENLTERALARALDDAVALARASAPHVTRKAEVAAQSPHEALDCQHGRIDPRTVSVTEKMKALLALEAAGRADGGSRIVNSVIGYADGFLQQTLANSFGTVIEWETTRTRIYGMYTAAEGELMQRAVKSHANICGFELVRELTPEEFTVKLSRKAIGLLHAKRPPVGTFPVVFHPSITGLLMHEALGHNAEADLVLAGESILAGKEGQPIASELVTVIDDPTIPDSYGSYRYDSEGTPGGRRALIENGKLIGFLHSLETAGKFGVAPNGAGRADGYLSVPIVRMSNTFMKRGETPFEELISGIDRGIYLKDGHWGYVFVDKGQFTCHAGQAQMIENGKLGEPLRDVSVSGMMLETLKDIDGVGDDFEMDMPGTCGKDGQGAPVNTGGPHVRVAKLVVGGV